MTNPAHETLGTDIDGTMDDLIADAREMTENRTNETKQEWAEDGFTSVINGELVQTLFRGLGKEVL